MNYEAFLELTIDLAYEVQRSGAETYRVEDTVTHLLRAYGVQGEVFAIPNTIIVSIRTPEGEHLNRMRRSKGGGTDMESLEKFAGLCREICREKPDLKDFKRRLEETRRDVRRYSKLFVLLGHALAAGGFTLFFGGQLIDVPVGLICGLVIGLCGMLMDRVQTNVFFRTVASGFALCMAAYTMFWLGFGKCPDATIIGSLMLLVPGLLFTNSVRDVIYGDSMSGVNRMVQVAIIAIALAVGTGAAASLCYRLFDLTAGAAEIVYPFWVQTLGAVVAATGFMMVFNVHGHGCPLSLVGCVLSWGCCTLCMSLGMSEALSFLPATAAAAVYAEVMARIRRCPATAYLVIALLPLIPGSSIYYTMVHAVRGEMAQFSQRGMNTAALAGAMAVGILLVSTAFRMWTTSKMRRLALKAK